MNSQSLALVDAFVRLGSASAAAERLGLRPSALIRALHHAGDELGVPVAVRLQGRLVPTPEAHALAPAAAHALDAMAQARREARFLRAGVFGRLRVAAVPGVAHGLLPQVLAALAARPDAVPVELEFDHVAQRVLEATVELGLSYGVATPARAALHSRRVRRFGWVALMRRSERLARIRRPLVAADLRGVPLVAYGKRPEDDEGDRCTRSLERAGLLDHVSIVVRQTDVAPELVRSGCGVALIEDFALQPGAIADLVARPLGDLAPMFIEAHHLRGTRLSVAARQVLHELARVEPGRTHGGADAFDR